MGGDDHAEEAIVGRAILSKRIGYSDERSMPHAVQELMLQHGRESEGYRMGN